MNLKSIDIFISYAHEDEKLCKELEKHLSTLKNQELITVWHNREISPGKEWKREIDRYLQEADIILILVSPAFINSRYCYSIEMKQSMERHQRGEARILPIILRPTLWKETPLGELQALPTNARPVIDPGWSNRDYAFHNIAEGIRKVVKEVRTEKVVKEVRTEKANVPQQQPAFEFVNTVLRLYVLGQFRLERRSSPSNPQWHTVTEAAWQRRHVRDLLSCLLSSPGRRLGREQLMDALWPEIDLETATNRLDRAVYSLRQLFEPSRGKLATSPLLLTEREVLTLAEQTQVWVDADAFEGLLVQAHESNDPGKQEQLLEEAMLLYGGDFLPEAQRAEWSQPRRDSLMRAWIGLLLELSDLRNEREAFASAIEPLDRLLAVDPANEAAVQRLMLHLATLGRRGEALRAYRKLASMLQQEYRISPLSNTRAIYEKVRGGQRTPSEAGGTAPAGTQLAGAESPRTPTRSDTPATIQIGRSHQSPLVGREQEVALLRDLVTSTEQAAKFRMPGAKKSSVLALDTQRRPQCMLLMGEVGIGKTRLAEEVSRDAKRRNWAVAWSRVYAQEGSIPYRLWTEVLRKAMEQGAWQRQEVSKRSLVFQPLSALLPDVLQPLLVQTPYSYSLPPEQEQLRLWEAACELLKLISESTPLLIALDDLQWADASSCELLAYLARRVQGYPIVIVGTCRDNELPPNHALRPLLTDLQREHAVECISLAPLSDEQIDALVSSIQVPQPLVQRIRKRAAGNPFFAEELARTITSSTAINGTLINDGKTGTDAHHLA